MIRQSIATIKDDCACDGRSEYSRTIESYHFACDRTYITATIVVGSSAYLIVGGCHIVVVPHFVAMMKSVCGIDGVAIDDRIICVGDAVRVGQLKEG
jgi:hypothetical protein